MSEMDERSLLRLDELISAVDGTLAGKVDSIFTSVTTDSRNVKAESLFVPLVGEKQDGHLYIRKAVEGGASVVFAMKEKWDRLPEDDVNYVCSEAAVIFVRNTLYALQAAAAAYVRKFPGLIRIGITGSNGKTTTKEIAASVISRHYKVIATEGNFNSETGLPLSVFNIRPEHEAGIFEMGMNRKDEIKELAEVLSPSYGIITNVGTAHIGILGSKDNIAEEKKKIFGCFQDDACRGFVPENDGYAEYLSDIPVGTVRLFGPEHQQNVRNVRDEGMRGTSFEYDGKEVTFPLPGSYNFMNMLGVVALAEELGIPSDEIRAGIEDVRPLFGRSRLLEGKFTVVQDCYNANAESMAVALKFYGNSKIKGKVIFVIGDMLELGDDSEKIHSSTGEIAVGQKPSAVFFIGSEMRHAYDAAIRIRAAGGLNVSLVSEEHTDDASVAGVAEQVLRMAEEGDLILVKGSRGLRLERVVDYICEKGGIKQ